MESSKRTFAKRKPKFCKIKDIEPGRHCYNVYCKILKLTRSENQNTNGETYITAEGQVGDETGIANFLFRGDHSDGLKEGQIVALRNGRSNVVQDYIRLELDRFGKVSQENFNIESIDMDNDISSVAYVLQGRR